VSSASVSVSGTTASVSSHTDVINIFTYGNIYYPIPEGGQPVSGYMQRYISSDISQTISFASTENGDVTWSGEGKREGEHAGCQRDHKREALRDTEDAGAGRRGGSGRDGLLSGSTTCRTGTRANRLGASTSTSRSRTWDLESGVPCSTSSSSSTSRRR
jgi:hypothetical protein